MNPEENSDAVINLIRPAWTNTQRVKDGLGLYEGISLHAAEINKTSHASFFGVTQQLALETTVIGICKLYDTSNQRYKKHTIIEALGSLSGATSLYHTRAARNDLIELGMEEREAQEILDSFTRNSVGVKAHLLTRLGELLPNVKTNPGLERIFLYRNKIAAHQEILNEADQELLKFLPPLEEIEQLNSRAENFCCLYVKLATPNAALVPSVVSARMAALNVIAKVLGKNYDDPEVVQKNFAEYEAFYARQSTPAA